MEYPKKQLALAQKYLKQGHLAAAKDAACRGISALGYTTVPNALKQEKTAASAIQRLQKAIAQALVTGGRHA